MTLEDAIDQQINLGLSDPLEIVDKVVKLHGDAWLRAAVGELAFDVATNLARARIGTQRNTTLVHSSKSRKIKTDLLLKVKWVPKKGYIKIGDLTAEDCRLIAKHYLMLSDAATARAYFYNRIAEEIELNQAKDVKGLAKKAELPDFSDMLELTAGTS